jgi:hypothetical protein
VGLVDGERMIYFRVLCKIFFRVFIIYLLARQGISG